MDNFVESKNKKKQKVKYYLGLTKYDSIRKIFEYFPDWKKCENEEQDWDIMWLDNSLAPDRFVKMKHFQKVNHFIGTYSITRKNYLGRNLSKMKKMFPEAFKFFPSTWILPTDFTEFKQQFKNKKENKTFIIKPESGSQGRGIFLVKKYDDIKYLENENMVAQRYVQRPFLLDGHKFDLRLYILLTGCNPMRIFLHRDGLIRLATELYESPNNDNITTTLMHLTNYSLNKFSANYKISNNPEDHSSGHKRSMRHVFDKLQESGFNMLKVKKEIEDMIIKTLISIQPSLAHSYSTCQPKDLSNSMCFEILGFDIMLDHKLKPWLLEINHSPSFSINSQVDKLVKIPVIFDAIKLLNIKGEDKWRNLISGIK